MSQPMQPIYLFADSQLLFWKRDGIAFLDSIRALCPGNAPKAAYIGASNGDAPEFYDIFLAAMDGIGIGDCRMIRAEYSSEEAAFLEEADLIVLAGGDVEKGWMVFEQTGIKETLIRRYNNGAALIGVSAGAVQLGLYGAVETAESSHRLIDTFKFVPFIVSAHDEDREWQELTSIIQLMEGTARGIGIPKGTGVIYHPDRSIEVIRGFAHEFSMANGKMVRELLLPKE